MPMVKQIAKYWLYPIATAATAECTQPERFAKSTGAAERMTVGDVVATFLTKLEDEAFPITETRVESQPDQPVAVTAQSWGGRTGRVAINRAGQASISGPTDGIEEAFGALRRPAFVT